MFSETKRTEKRWDLGELNLTVPQRKYQLNSLFYWLLISRVWGLHGKVFAWGFCGDMVWTKQMLRHFHRRCGWTFCFSKLSYFHCNNAVLLPVPLDHLSCRHLKESRFVSSQLTFSTKDNACIIFLLLTPDDFTSPRESSHHIGINLWPFKGSLSFWMFTPKPRF